MKYESDRAVHLLDCRGGAGSSWALQEVSGDGGHQGPKQDPLSAWLVFSATELTVFRNTKSSREANLDGVPSGHAHRIFPPEELYQQEVKDTTHIRGSLRPGSPGQKSTGRRRAETYSMFGTGRVIDDFHLTIEALPDDEVMEYYIVHACLAWQDSEYPPSASPDFLEISVYLSRQRFAALLTALNESGASVLVLTLGSAKGFYSPWSPIGGDHPHVKVLPSKNKWDSESILPLVRPGGITSWNEPWDTFEPPRPGGREIGFELTVRSTKRFDCEEPATVPTHPKTSEENEPDVVPAASRLAEHSLDVADQSRQTLERISRLLGNLRVPLWLSVGLLLILLLR